MPNSERVNVAVGIIYNLSKDHVLISRRRKSQHQAGLWEFPGGKAHKNESTELTLKRELYEELGIIVTKLKPLISFKYDYPKEKVFLHFFYVLDWKGKVRNRETQQITWVKLDSLHSYSFLAANICVTRLIVLPKLYLISQIEHIDMSLLLRKLRLFYQSGLKIFQLRHVSKEHYLDKWINRIKKLSESFNAKLILNGTPKDIDLYNVDGLHFKAKEALKYKQRPIDNTFLLGVSCHCEREIEQAILIDADYIFISPIKKTNTHPESAYMMGWHKFSALTNITTIPVYALGGMETTDLVKAREKGAHGIALISSIWNAKNPESLIKNAEGV